MRNVPSPLVGFNNNVKHNGRIFHIQTEDSGVKRPHVVTHLFADGGRIVKSTRTDYTEHLGRPDMPDVLRRLMKEQHKAMFIALRAGEYDGLIEGLDVAPSAAANAGRPAEAPAAAGAPMRSQPPPKPSRPPRGSRPPGRMRSQPPPKPSRPARQGAPPAPARGPGPEPPRVHASSGRPASTPPGAPGAGAPLDLEVSALAVPRLPGLDDPQGDERAQEFFRPPPPRKGGTPALGTPAEAQNQRYAASRPAAIFGAAPPKSTLFGEGLGEKSLDEVILGYLAEDLEEPPK